MVFLIPLLILIAIIFGVDYLYFSDEDAKVQDKKEQKKEQNSSLEKQRQEYLENLFKKKTK